MIGCLQKTRFEEPSFGSEQREPSPDWLRAICLAADCFLLFLFPNKSLTRLGEKGERWRKGTDNRRCAVRPGYETGKWVDPYPVAELVAISELFQ